MSSKNESISEKTTKLTKLIDWFDGNEFVLELAVDKFKQASALADDIEKDLLTLKNEVQIIKQKFDSDK